jgi:SsrA-binding protein
MFDCFFPKSNLSTLCVGFFVFYFIVLDRYGKYETFSFYFSYFLILFTNKNKFCIRIFKIMVTQKNEEKNIAVNRKARHDYSILQTFEAGIVLQGTEVKSLRLGKANLVDSYATLKDGEMWLVGAHINIYEQGNINNHEPTRTRKLLLNKSEIRKLVGKVKEKGLTLIPLRLYFKNGKAKVEIALAKGKKIYDKREAIAKKDLQRDSERKIKF